MKTVRITNGDIVLSVSRRMDFVYGQEKLVQDLKHWLAEPMGLGPTTRTFGSYLSEYIGTDDPESMKTLVSAEVKRVLGLYQAHQMRRLTQAKKNGTLGMWSRQEVLEEVVGVEVSSDLDAVSVHISVRTMANSDLSFSIHLGGGI